MRSVAFALVMLTAFIAKGVEAQDGATLRLMSLGDMPYGAPAEVYPAYETLISEINARRPDIVVHVGDTKSGGSACTDQLLAEQLAYLQAFDAPLLYTPGDNEWTDCHRGTGAGSDPLERLEHIRTTYFTDPATSFGRASVEVEHQGAAGYPENARFATRGVGIITAHVVGSNNNFEPRNMDNVQEFFARSRASTEWLQQSFEAFADQDAIVLAIHADMFEFDFNPFGRERWLRHSGFHEFGSALKEVAQSYGKPVLLVFGDSHRHVIFRPFPNDVPNLLAMEVYGAREMHAVEIIVSPGAEEPFEFETVWNPALSE